MHAHEYGSKHFKHKTNFKGLVVFSDVQQQKIKETVVPSPNIYVEIEKRVQNPNKWFLHINSILSGEYGDFFLQENPQPVGEVLNDFDYDISPENTAFIESYYDFSLGEISYYKINEKFYIKLWGDILKDDAFFEIQNSSKSQQKEEISIEYDAFITVFVSDNGAKLERAYQNITKVNTHQIVVFIESGGGTNAFGTVFRIHKGKNVKTLPEVDRLTLSKVAKAFGVQVQTNDLSKMIKEELAEEDSLFYLLVTKKLLKGGRIIRWSTKDVFTDISGGLKNASKEVNKLKLGEERWNTAFKDKSGSKYNPLLPKLRGENNLFDVEKFSNDVYKTYIQPAATQATSIGKLLLKKRRFAKLIPFDISRAIEVLDAIPTQLQDFFDSVSNHLLDLYEYINGLLVGLINSIIEFVKSFIDILAMLFDVLNAAIQSTEFFENPASYLSLFAESFENLMDGFVALFTLENLKAIFGFIASMPAYAVKIVFRFLTSDVKVKIDPGALGYYIGFFVGFVASEVATFFLTGGTGTIAKALKETLRSYKALAEIPKKAAKVLGNTVQFGIDTFVKLGTIIADFIKNIPKHLKTLRKWLDEFFEKLASTVNQLFNGFEAVLELLYDLGVVIFEKLDPNTGKVLVSPDGVIYTLKQGDKTILEGTEDAIRKFAQKIDEIRSSGGNSKKKVQKSLDEASETRRLKNLLRKDVEEFIAIRNELKNLPADEILRRFQDSFDVKNLEVRNFYSELTSQYPKLKGGINDLGDFEQVNFASFNTIMKAKGNKVDEILDLVHSGKDNIYNNFIKAFDQYDDVAKRFQKGVVDNRGQPRRNDSEFKYIYHFLKNYLNKADEFIIETKNIYFACNSCQRELLMLKVFLNKRGKSMKLIVYGDNNINRAQDLYKLIK